MDLRTVVPASLKYLRYIFSDIENSFFFFYFEQSQSQEKHSYCQGLLTKIVDQEKIKI